MIRVLIVSTTDLGFNGITSVIMNYYRNIDKKKIQFDFVICEKIHESVSDEIKKLGGNIYILPSRKKRLFKYIKSLKSLVKENNYKVVHVHGNSGTLYFDIHALKQVGVSVRIAHSHNSTCTYKIIHRLLKKPLSRETTHPIACSKLAGDWLFTKDYTVLNNGIDIEKFKFNNEVRDKYRREMDLEDKYVIGHVGNFLYQKNHEYLLKVFKEVVNRNPKAVLMLVGDGKLEAEIKSLINRLGIQDSVLMLGKRSDTAELMQAMDVFVFPSRFEGLPVVLVEAQSAGLKCIISNAITKECQITGEVEYLDLSEEIDKWVDKILMIKSGYQRNIAFEKVRKSKFNIKNETKKLEEIYISNF